MQVLKLSSAKAASKFHLLILRNLTLTNQTKPPRLFQPSGILSDATLYTQDEKRKRKKAEENDDQNKDEKLDLGKLQEAISSLPESVQQAVIQGVRTASQESDDARLKAQAEKNEDNDDDDDPGNIDLESLDRAGLVGHINKNTENAIKRALKPLVQQLQTTSDAGEADRIRTDFRQAAARFPDFLDWREEMGEIIKKHPELPAEDVYALARSKDPEKVKDIDEKTSKGKKEEDDKVKKAFGGLTPTSGSSITKDTNKSPEDAANSAWDETMSAVPAELIGGNI